MAFLEEKKKTYWFVMRDLKRANAKLPAYKQLEDMGIEEFTPMIWHLTMKQGKKIREKVPFVRDLLFVHDTREHLDPIVDRIPTLQYRYMRGEGYCTPMTVKENEMRYFMLAVNSTDSPCYYLPEEITVAMYGHRVRIVGGPLDGCEGHLLNVRGARNKRLIVELPNLLSVKVEVNPDFIELLED